MSDTLTAKGRKLTGYALEFGVPSLDLGGFREVIAPDALDRTKAEAPDLRALVNHDANQLIGRASSGTLKYAVDAKGLKVEIAPPDTQAGRDIAELVRRRDISGMSFSFVTLTDDWKQEGDRVIRTLHDISIREVSAVAWPAYPSTSVQVDAARSDREASIERWNSASPENAVTYRARMAQAKDVGRGKTLCGVCRKHMAVAVRRATPQCAACLTAGDTSRHRQFETAARRDRPHGRHSRAWWEAYHRLM